MIPGVEIVRNPRARRVRLTVDPASGRARLVVPPRMALKAAVAWASAHDRWLATQRSRLPEARPFVDGARLPVAGEEIRVVHDAAGPRTPRREGAELRVGGPVDMVARRVTAWLRHEAARVLAEDTHFYAARAGVSVTGVAVGDPRGRWGSCSGSGAIRYSWRLLLAPVAVRRATAAHEVAHRVHMNHGPAFHALVAELFGEDPMPHRRWLKANGAGLHWFGRDSG